MTLDELRNLCGQYKNRKKRIESDCSVVEKVWALYKRSQDDRIRRKAVTWLIKRLEDKTTNTLVLGVTYRHLYRERHHLSKKHLRRFRKSLRKMPRRQRKDLKLLK